MEKNPKTEFDKNDYKNFATIFKNSQFFVMRFTKLEAIFKDIQAQTNVCLLKGPAGSGKSFMANLFKYYLEKVRGIKKIIYYISNENQSYQEFLKEFQQKTKLDFLNPDEDAFYIFDEAQFMYSEGYKDFWNKIKIYSEQKSIQFLFCAIYSNTRADSNEFTPVILKGKFRSLEFLSFEEEEFNCLVDAYEECYENDPKFLKYNPTQRHTMFNLFQGHPEISQKALIKISEYCEHFGIKFKDDGEFHKTLQTYELLYNQIIHTCKARPKKCEFNNEQLNLLKYVHLNQSIVIDENESIYPIAKNLESKGYLFENRWLQKFTFASPLIGSMIYYHLHKIESYPVPSIETLNKFDLVEIALSRMKRKELLNAMRWKNNVGKQLAEDQWVNHLYSSFLSMIDPKKENCIISQGSKDIHEDFIGELDLFINGRINKGVEITRDNVLEHLLRRYRALYPTELENVEYNKKTLYIFPPNVDFLVVHFTPSSVKFQGLKTKVNDKDGNVIDLSYMKMEKDLMRVMFDDKNLEWFDIYREENFYKRIGLMT